MATERPFLPSDKIKPRQHLVRAALAIARNGLTTGYHQGGAEGLARATWPADKLTPVLIRAAVSPTDATTAAPVALAVVSDFLKSLRPLSAPAPQIQAA